MPLREVPPLNWEWPAQLSSDTMNVVDQTRQVWKSEVLNVHPTVAWGPRKHITESFCEVH